MWVFVCTGLHIGLSFLRLSFLFLSSIYYPPSPVSVTYPPYPIPPPLAADLWFDVRVELAFRRVGGGHQKALVKMFNIVAAIQIFPPHCFFYTVGKFVSLFGTLLRAALAESWSNPQTSLSSALDML